MKLWVRLVLIGPLMLAVATRAEAQMFVGAEPPVPAAFPLSVFSPSGADGVISGQRVALSIGSLESVKERGTSGKRFSGSYAVDSSLHVGLGISRELNESGWQIGEPPRTSISYAPYIRIVPVRQGHRFPVTVFATANLLLTRYVQAAPGQRLTGSGYGLGVSHAFDFARGVNIATYASHSWSRYAQRLSEYTAQECPPGGPGYCMPHEVIDVVHPARKVRGSQTSYSFGLDASVTVRPGAIVFAGPMIVAYSVDGVNVSQTGLRIGIAM